MEISRKTWILLIANMAVLLGFAGWSAMGKWKQQQSLDQLLSKNNDSAILGVTAKNSNCHINGNLPDGNCTPGAILDNATVEKICVSGYTKTVRNVSTNTRKEVYAMYGIDYPQARGSYEVDHLIPLALGGSNEVANLWPEAANPRPGFKEKDVVEVYLYEKVCKGEIDLAAAQQQIAKNWLEIYQILSQDEEKRIRNAYKNWAN